MYLNADQKLKQLPPEYKEDLLEQVRKEFVRAGKTIVVLDDDPTGTQTCYDITVLTSWETDLVAEELKKKPAILFILTNSRSLPESQAITLAFEIGNNLQEAIKQSGQSIVLISRSDSTLRGHFPAEVNAIASKLDMTDAVIVLIPAFIEGGRFTIDDVHYLVENGDLVPVSDTPFARDLVFGYKQADLKKWVEEKTKGKIKSGEVDSISLEDIRTGGPELVSKMLGNCLPGSVCIANAVSYRDLEVIAMGLMIAENQGKKFLYRSSATIVPIRAGMEASKPFVPVKEKMISANGSLIVVGSYVPKSTAQLEWLLSTGRYKSFEIKVAEILDANRERNHCRDMINQIDKLVAAGNDVLVYTSRKLETGNDHESSLRINARVSAFLVDIVRGLSVRPKCIIAKGGITSNDLASKGLSAKKASVLGPIIPGVPVWQMDEKSKFPGIMYVVFPGNVGERNSIDEVNKKLNGVLNA